MRSKNLISIFFAFVLLVSIIPTGFVTAATPTAEQVNDYSLEVASFVKEKCHGSCENVVILGDDYVVPSFRRDIKWLNWYYFVPWLQDSKVDKILTDIGYVQRSEMEFSNLYALVTKQLDGANFEGKNILIIVPDSLSTEQRRAINDLKSEFETQFKSHFSEKKGSEVYCNDPQLWNNMNGYTLIVIGTEENNYAFNCFPFQAGLENRDAAFIDINPWDGRNYAIILNTNDDLIIKIFTQFIHDETYKGIRSETAYFFKIGTKVAVYSAITLAVLSGVGAAAGFAGAGALAVTANVVNVAADAAVVTDSCYYDSYKYGESWGGCVKDAVIVIVLPKVLEKTTKYVISNVLVYFSKFGDDVIRVFKSPGTDSVFKDGTRAAGTAVLREGTESWGWKHILLRGHNNEIKTAFNLIDNDKAVKDFIAESLGNGIKNSKGEIVYEKLINGHTKKILIIIGKDLDKLGAIISAYPVT
jgi:hypothetical protein